jgi:hypothetical protein
MDRGDCQCVCCVSKRLVRTVRIKLGTAVPDDLCLGRLRTRRDMSTNSGEHVCSPGILCFFFLFSFLCVSVAAPRSRTTLAGRPVAGPSTVGQGVV